MYMHVHCTSTLYGQGLGSGQFAAFRAETISRIVFLCMQYITIIIGFEMIE